MCRCCNTSSGSNCDSNSGGRTSYSHHGPYTKHRGDRRGTSTGNNNSATYTEPDTNSFSHPSSNTYPNANRYTRTNPHNSNQGLAYTNS